MQVRWIESDSRLSMRSRLVELWLHRELVYFLFLRELKIRYKQTAVGVLWVVLQPLLSTMILSVALGYLTKSQSDGPSYPLFLMTGIVPWTFFAGALGAAAMSLIMNEGMVTKIYFPRAATPLAAVCASLADFGICLALLGAIVLAVQRGLPVTAAVLPMFVALAFVAALGAGLMLAAVNVTYRDVRYTIPFMTQLWMFATPVFYSAAVWRSPWDRVAALNPMVGVIEGFRWALLNSPLRLDLIAISAASSLALLVAGLFAFLHLEPDFADTI